MKEIDIRRIKINSSKFITRLGKEVKFLNYVPEAGQNNRLLFLLEGNILGCDEQGKCWTVNSYDSSYSETDFRNFDVFVDDLVHGYINIYKSASGYFSHGIYNSREEAKEQSVESDNFIKTIKIEWSEDDESKSS